MTQSMIRTLPLLGLLAVPAWPADNTTLDTIEITATRLRGVADVDVPASVTTVELNADTNRPQINATEALAPLAGVTALDRQNYAQDTQLSIRGFGARSTFGVRSLRLFADGVPATMPDGQGQLSNFNLMGGDRLQVMRGPFSALYGNSSGGVVQIWSKAGEVGDPTRVRATYGSNNARSVGAQTLGRVGAVDYNLALSRFETDGYRDHSAARRDSVNARLGFDLGDRRSLSLVLNYLDLPAAQDPLGLTRAQWNANPRQVFGGAVDFNTRKTVQQLQGGLVFEQKIADSQVLRVMGYTGNRKAVQFLAIPVATQANAKHSGGVVDLDNDYRGVDLRWSFRGALAGKPLELTVGTNADEQQQLRKGFENFLGSTRGVRGALRRNEDDRVANVDQFAQIWIQLDPRWSLLAGVRHSEVNFRSQDHYIVGVGATGNPDDSGSKTYTDTTPVAGIMFHPVESLRLYASAGNGFETPTFNELSYRADGSAGLALNLRPASSKNLELGAKWRSHLGIELDTALFRANTSDEMAVVRNSGGRSSFRNIDKARRQGFEASLGVPMGTQWRADLAYTFVDAHFLSAYSICATAPCTVPNVNIAAGSRIPGVPSHQGYARLQWSPGAWTAAVEASVISKLIANETGTEAAPGYGLLHAEVGHKWTLGSGALRGFTRVENILDKAYIGSVIVNEGNQRYYESGADRTILVGAQWQWRP
jgi:iron complex outermembrane recepter protein